MSPRALLWSPFREGVDPRRAFFCMPRPDGDEYTPPEHQRGSEERMPLFYTIRVHAIPLTDATGSRACTVTAAAFAQAIETVNGIFEPAGVRFAFDPARDWHPRRSTSLNSLHNGGSNWWVEANQVAAGLRGQFTVFLRWGKDV